MAKTTIHSDYIPDNAITSTKIAENSIGAREIATNAITTLYVADGSVSSEKLASNIDIAGTFDVTGATTLDSTLSVSGDITGTLATAAQPNITSVGTLTGLTITAATPSIQMTDSDNNADAYIQATDGNIRFYADDSAEAADSIVTFNIDGSERMRIDSSGNVGIGNTSPLGKLTISNAAGTNAPTTVTAANTYLQLGSDDYGASNNGKFMIGFGYTDATNTNSPAYIGYEETSTSGDTKGELTFYTRDVITDTAPSKRMRIDTSGSLLVNTDSPGTNRLKIVGDASRYGILSENLSGYGAFHLKSTTVAQTWSIGAVDNSSNSDLFIYGGSSAGTKVTLASSGNVGIGVDNPNNKLEVDGHIGLSKNGTNGNRYLLIEGADATYAGTLNIQAGFGSTAAGGAIKLYAHSHATYPGSVWIGRSSGASGNIMFGNGGTGPTSSSQIQMMINSSGYVGIGDTSPAHKLEIESLDNYKAVHIKGTNAPCYTMARGTGSDAEWRMGLSGYDYDDFAISAGTGTGDKFRIDPNGNSWQGSVNNYTPRDGLHDIGQTASFNGPIASGYAEGPGGNGAAPIIHDWFVYSSASNIGSNNYVHMKTSLLGGGTGSGNQDFTMSCFTYHNYYGYGSNYYGYGVIGWHNWSGAFYNVMKNNYGNFNLVQDSYMSSDGYVVLVAYIQAAHAQFTIDWAQWAGYTFRQARVTDVTNTSSATGAY